ncbi:hypothetical protein MAR_024487 [Mya arenaria]|uniref:Uncharacterized protein n=1 Tax=Mya arenaria TaxID=6604 RepID=A0ABY7DU25_MYAAR|nr:hypothetical protein MAR_024487 [Mya arenaria]
MNSILRPRHPTVGQTGRSGSKFLPVGSEACSPEQRYCYWRSCVLPATTCVGLRFDADESDGTERYVYAVYAGKSLLRASSTAPRTQILLR